MDSRNEIDKILNFLEKNGECLDQEIAAGIGNDIARVREYLVKLQIKGDIITCQVTRFIQGVQVEGISSRLAAQTFKPSPGRKPK